ncbi:MAG: helix-turn-helix domain-containing protein [Acidimicrobiia bacterium]
MITNADTEKSNPNRSRRIEALLTADDIAELLGVPKRYVYRLVADRRIPFVKWGHYVRFERQAINEWVAANRVPETSVAAGRLRR